MKTVLILTVGGSHQPILTSIAEHRPEQVYFLCSADAGKLRGSYEQVVGAGKVLKSKFDLQTPDLPNIATLAGLSSEQFEVRKIEHFDDLNDCYLQSWNAIEKARHDWPDARILVDYTGGTKSMTAGLAAAALDDGQCEISLVVGRRADLVKVEDRTEFVRPIQVWDVQVARRIQSAHELLERFDYAGAAQLLRQAAARFASNQTRERLERGIALCRAFDAWDKLDHAGARALLQPYQGSFVPYWRFLKALTGEAAGHGFELVEDLDRNADRRFCQGRYDDAVGRFYRAIELTAQVWLKQRHDIDTGEVRLEAVPEAERARIERARDGEEEGKAGKIKMGLLEAWDLIACFPDDGPGKLFKDRRGHIVAFLSTRNQSLFAHGTRPVSREDYSRHVPMLKVFLAECIEAGLQALNLKRLVVLEQLPTDFLATSDGEV